MKDIYATKIGHQGIQREVGGFRKGIRETGGSGESREVRKGCMEGIQEVRAGKKNVSN